VTDQHSQVQLFSDGPNDKLIMFIAVEKFAENPEIPVLVSHEKTDFLNGVDFAKLLHAEMQGTALALTEKGKPNFTITIDEISAKNLGELFVLFEGATAFLGEFMELNVFDQPGVERGKGLTRDILGK
jgi:glucose-6-phosphate isomerase